MMGLLSPLAPCFSNNLSAGKESVDSKGHNHKDTPFGNRKGFFFFFHSFFYIAGGLLFSSQDTYFDDDCVIMKNS